MELQKIFVTLALNADEFGRGLKDAADKAQGFAGQVGDRLKQFGQVAIAATAGAGAAIVGLGAGIVSLASSAAPIAGVQAGFETLTSSMEGGSAAMLRALQDSSGGLITNTDLMQSFNKAAALVSDDFAESMPDAMGYLSKVAAATGQDMGFMLDSLVTGVGRLSPMILDNLGIQVNLTEANEAYAASIGKTASELTQSEQQTALMNQVLEKLAENTAGMEGMSNPFEAFKVTMQNLKDEIGVQLLPVVAPLMEKFTELAQGLLPSLMGAVEGVIGKLQIVSDVVLKFVGNLQEGMGPLDAFILAMQGILPPEMLATLADFRDNVLPGLMQKFTEIKDRVVEFVTPIASAVVQFVSWKDVLIVLAGVIGGMLLMAIANLVIAMAPILLTVGAVIAIVALLRNAWENNWGDIQGKVAAVWAVVQPILAAVMDWVGEKVRQAVDRLREFWVNVAWPAIQRGIEIVWPIIRGIFEAIGDFVTGTLIPAIQRLYRTWTEDVWPVIQRVTQNVWTIVKEIFTELGRWINDNIVPWVDALRRGWEENWDLIKKAVDIMWKHVGPIWESIQEWAEKTIPPILITLRGFFETAMSGIQAAIQPVKDVWDAFKGAVEGFWNWLTGKTFTFDISFPELPDWLKFSSPIRLHTKLIEFSDDMGRIGQKIADGFARAFENLPTFGEQIYGLVGAGNTVGGLAGSFASFFERRVVRPLQDGIDKANAEIAAAGSIYGQYFTLSKFDPNAGEKTRRQLEMLRNQIAAGIYYNETHGLEVGDWQRDRLGIADDALRAYETRNNLNAEFIKQQERLAALDQARAELDYLKSQMDLIQMISDNADILPGNLLDGFQFGVDADPGKFMDLMVDTLERIVLSTSYSLNKLSSPTLSTPTPGEDRGSTIIQTQNINGGQHIYLYDTDESELANLLALSL